MNILIDSVVKRNGELEDISFDKISERIKNICLMKPQLTNVNVSEMAKSTIKGIYAGITTKELDDISANNAVSLSFDHPEYGVLASRLLVNNYHKNNILYIFNHFNGEISLDDIKNKTYLYVCKILYENKDIHGEQHPIIAPDLYKIILNNHERIENLIDYSYDYNYDYAGFKMLEKTYLSKAYINVNGENKHFPIERPQHLLMRVSIGISCSKTYVNFNSLRENQNKIYNETSHILKKYLNRSTLDQLLLNLKTSSIEWKNIIQIIEDQHNDIDDVNFIKNSININTLSWDKLLNIYNGIITDEQWKDIEETYLFLRNKYFIHATPTLFNVGTLKPQLSSCFLVQLPHDSMDSITDFWKTCATISKWAGGIGSNVHNIRSKGSYIRGTNGQSNGLPSMLKVVNDQSVYVDQGGNKRPGSHAIYLELWHGDIFEVLDLKKNRGNDAERARNLFYGLWVSDEFMRSVKSDSFWYLMCPDQCKNLSNLYDKKLCDTWISDDELFNNPNSKDNYAFTYCYRSYVKEGKFVKKISAKTLWIHICDVITETGIPYICFKDSSNRKTNQQNLGTIKCSNLCTEIMEYTSSQEIAVCNLTSMNQTSILCDHHNVSNHSNTSVFNDGFDTTLPTSKINGKTLFINWDLYEKIIRRQVINLNKVIDINYYPIKEAYYSNKKNRPIAIGTQDLANLFTLLRLPWESDKAMELNFYLYEFMYFIALDESCNIAMKHRLNKMEKYFRKNIKKYNLYLNDLSSGAYKSFKGSPASKGLLQMDLWLNELPTSIKYNLSLKWDELKNKIKLNGLRNSLLLGLMPTGSTSTILGCSPCFEPHNALIYKRRNKLGEYNCINRYLINDLLSVNLWNSEVKNKLMSSEKGSIENIDSIPKSIKDIYKTVWNISNKTTSNMCLTRGVFIDQSQSYSLFVPRPTINNLTQIHFYNWKNGIKTSSYYTRRLAVVDASKLQLEQEKQQENIGEVCTFKPGCKSCES